MRLGYHRKKAIKYSYAFQASMARTKDHGFKVELARLKLIFYDTWMN